MIVGSKFIEIDAVSCAFHWINCTKFRKYFILLFMILISIGLHQLCISSASRISFVDACQFRLNFSASDCIDNRKIRMSYSLPFFPFMKCNFSLVEKAYYFRLHFVCQSLLSEYNALESFFAKCLFSWYQSIIVNAVHFVRVLSTCFVAWELRAFCHSHSHLFLQTISSILRWMRVLMGFWLRCLY